MSRTFGVTMATALGIAFAGPASAGAPAPARQSWRVASSELSYKLEHKLHTVVGTSHAAQGAAVVDKDGARVMVRVPVKSFDSGNANRNVHMLEVVEGARYPFVVLKGRVSAAALRAAGSRGKVDIDAELDFHGVRTRRRIAVALSHPDAKHLEVSFRFPVSLTAHKIERPSLLFIKVKDNIIISGKVKMELKS
jgi:hypothetical protein